jgi:hypothetical protein
VAATDGAGRRVRAQALVAAALALPMLPANAAAQAVADRGVLGQVPRFDWQPGANRMTVRPRRSRSSVNDTTEFEPVVYDAMSGASPLYFNTL